MWRFINKTQRAVGNGKHIGVTRRRPVLTLTLYVGRRKDCHSSPKVCIHLRKKNTVVSSSCVTRRPWSRTQVTEAHHTTKRTCRPTARVFHSLESRCMTEATHRIIQYWDRKGQKCIRTHRQRKLLPRRTQSAQLVFRLRAETNTVIIWQREAGNALYYRGSPQIF